MAKVVSFSNQKGGVGKTTSCVNIAAQIANKGKKVLLIDMDPQGNATSGLGLVKSKIKKTIYDVIIGRCDIKDAIIKTEFKNLSAVTANIDLAGAELELYELEEDKNFTKLALDSIKDDFDYIFIDCPPSLGMLTVKALRIIRLSVVLCLPRLMVISEKSVVMPQATFMALGTPFSS